MPRAKVPPGRSSKRSASSASSWRSPNLSCCATSGSAMPRSSRSAASSAPTPCDATAGPSVASVIFAALQLAIFVRGRIPAPELRGVALLGGALPRLALHAHREPQRLGARRDDLVVARHQRAGIGEAALLVTDLAKLQERRRLVRLQL